MASWYGAYALKLTFDLDELRQLATEVRDFVQNKIGSSEFSRTWEDIRKRSGSKREERRDAKHRMVSLGIQAHQCGVC